MSDGARTSRIVAGVLVAVVVIPLLVLTRLYPSTVGPFTVVFLGSGLVMLLRARRRRG